MAATNNVPKSDKSLSPSPDARPADVFARVVALATLALTCFNTYITFSNEEQEDKRHVQGLLNSAWDELAGTEAAPAIASSPVLTDNQRRELEKVGRKIDEALENDRENPMALTLKGIYFAKRRMPIEAREMFQKALTVDPKYARAKSALGRLLADEGKHKEAIAEFQAATSMDPRMPSPYLGWASCLRQLNRLNEAVVVLQKGISAEPAFAPLHLDLGNVYAEQGRNQKALEHYAHCREIDEFLPPCYKNAVVLLLRDKREPEAIELVNQAQAKGILIRAEKKQQESESNGQGS